MILNDHDKTAFFIFLGYRGSSIRTKNFDKIMRMSHNSLSVIMGIFYSERRYSYRDQTLYSNLSCRRRCKLVRGVRFEEICRKSFHASLIGMKRNETKKFRSVIKLDESTARRHLKSPRSLSGRSLHLTLVTKWSRSHMTLKIQISMSWPRSNPLSHLRPRVQLDMFDFCFVAIRPLLVEI